MVFIKRVKAHGITYLQLVEGYNDGRAKHRLLKSSGREDQLDPAMVDRLLAVRGSPVRCPRSHSALRVLFGSGHLDDIASELAKFRSIGLTDGALAACLGGTSRMVFGLP